MLFSSGPLLLYLYFLFQTEDTIDTELPKANPASSARDEVEEEDEGDEDEVEEEDEGDEDEVEEEDEGDEDEVEDGGDGEGEEGHDGEGDENEGDEDKDAKYDNEDDADDNEDGDKASPLAHKERPLWSDNVSIASGVV